MSAKKKRKRHPTKSRKPPAVEAPPVLKRNAPWGDCVEIEGPLGLKATLYLGDCREVMAALEPESLHSVVTDPPYELGFMGKAWDKADGVASDPETWRVVQALLKPGGHLVAFAGSRTYHRIAMAIERAEFEIRDQLMWLYGSGFPKSLDVAKAIDACDAKSETPEEVLRFTEWMRSTGITAKKINELTGTFMASHYLTAGSQPAVATQEHFEKLRPHLGKIPAWVEKLVENRAVRERARSENLARRQVIGKRSKEAQAARWRVDHVGGKVAPAGDITLAYTDEAKQWDGWGTALKPAHEPIALARKPFRGPVAGCVLGHGTGALNVGECRVGTELVSTMEYCETGARHGYSGGLKGGRAKDQSEWRTGRWPANVITDGSTEILEQFPPSARDCIRFFYAAKADKAEREYGLEDAPKTRRAGTCGDGVGNCPRVNGERPNERANIHPTVKPVELMRWLCRLITPPGGTVLEPFMGSGSTGIAALRENMHFVGIEQSREYFEIARRRIERAAEDLAREPDLVRQVDRAVAVIRAKQMALSL